MSLVSVVIPAYNSSEYIGGAVDSVLRQSFKDFEIIVVDDGSTDDTRRIVDLYLTDSRIRYIYEENRGLPGARNRGARQSQGEYLAFLDADDYLAPNALEMMLQVFRSSGVAWLNVGVLKIEGDKKTVRHPQRPAGDLFRAILDDDFITRSPFYSSEAFHVVGMYDEKMCNREDWDLNIRMIESGKPFALLDEPIYHYTRTPGSITTGNRRKICVYTERLLRKHHKRLADSGDREIGRIYAKNMWALARLYAYEIQDRSESLRCAWESLRYDKSIQRALHPLIHRLTTGLNV